MKNFSRKTELLRIVMMDAHLRGEIDFDSCNFVAYSAVSCYVRTSVRFSLSTYFNFGSLAFSNLNVDQLEFR